MVWWGRVVLALLFALRGGAQGPCLTSDDVTRLSGQVDVLNDSITSAMRRLTVALQNIKDLEDDVATLDVQDTDGTNVNVNTTVDLVHQLEANITHISQLQSNAEERWLLDVSRLWLLAGGLIGLFGVLGLALLHGAFSRYVGALHSVYEKLRDFAVATLVFWAFGFGFAFGYKDNTDANWFIGNGSIFLVSDGTFGTKGYGYGHVFYHTVLALVALTIATTSAFQDRGFHPTVLVFAVMFVAWIYPIPAHALWGLTGLFSPFALPGRFRVGAHGAFDFAGGGAVHVVAGAAGVVGAWYLGPRALPKDDMQAGRRRVKEGQDPAPAPPVWGSHPPSSHHRLYVALGTFLVWMGFVGLISGASAAAPHSPFTGIITTVVRSSTVAAQATVVSLISGACGGLFALVWYRWRLGYYDVSGLSCGVIAGLVSAMSGAPLMEPWGGAVVGVVGGAIQGVGGFFALKNGIDDSINAFGIHCLAGVWSMAAPGLLAGQENIHQTYGFRPAKYGWAYGGGLEQLGVQGLAALLLIMWSGGCTALVLWVLNRFLGLRATEDDEAEGLDVALHATTAHAPPIVSCDSVSNTVTQYGTYYQDTVVSPRVHFSDCQQVDTSQPGNSNSGVGMEYYAPPDKPPRAMWQDDANYGPGVDRITSWEASYEPPPNTATVY